MDMHPAGMYHIISSCNTDDGVDYMIHLSENLKELRKAAGITQEQLAHVLGVSPQAVSRWEIGTTYPDITLLPAIAGYFGVTLDQLLGMDRIQDENSLQAIMDEYGSNTAKGLVAENIRLLREAVRRYPNNYRLWLLLVRELSWERSTEEKERQSKEEALALSEFILQKCGDPQIRASVTSNMCYVYNALGQKEEAVRTAEKLPDIWSTSTALLQRLYNGEKKIRHCQASAASGLELLYFAMVELADLNYQDKDMTTPERIGIIRKCISMYELLYDKGDLLEYEQRLSECYRYIAAMEMLEGSYPAALDDLEKAAEHAVAYDTLPESPAHTTRMVRGYTELRGRNYTETECCRLADKLKWDRYDPVRSDPRFRAVIESIQPFAEE